jgi:hypothetical protein
MSGAGGVAHDIRQPAVPQVDSNLSEADVHTGNSEIVDFLRLATERSFSAGDLAVRFQRHDSEVRVTFKPTGRSRTYDRGGTANWWLIAADELRGGNFKN